MSRSGISNHDHVCCRCMQLRWWCWQVFKRSSFHGKSWLCQCVSCVYVCCSRRRSLTRLRVLLATSTDQEFSVRERWLGRGEQNTVSLSDFVNISLLDILVKAYMFVFKCWQPNMHWFNAIICDVMSVQHSILFAGMFFWSKHMVVLLLIFWKTVVSEDCSFAFCSASHKEWI